MSRVWLAGHRGLLGTALQQRLTGAGHEVLTAPRSELDLTDRPAVETWVRHRRPDVLVLSAARVGGIAANMADPVGFLIDNLRLQDVTMTSAAQAGVSTIVFVGSSCMYPKDTAQPMREEQLWTGPLEPTNASYAVAKLAGLQLALSLARMDAGLRVVLPVLSNLYGPGDHFDPQRSHVVPALARRFVDAQEKRAPYVELWGNGFARRELLYSADAADGIVFLMANDRSGQPVNVGTGTDVSIRELAEQMASVAGFEGEIRFDRTGPDGMARKVMDVSHIHSLGWRHDTELSTGLRAVVADYLERNDRD